MALNVFTFGQVLFVLFLILYTVSKGGAGNVGSKRGHSGAPPPIGFKSPEAKPNPNPHFSGAQHTQPQTVINQNIKHKTIIQQSAPVQQSQSPSLGDSFLHGMAGGAGAAIGHNLVNGGDNNRRAPEKIVVVEHIQVHGEIVNTTTTIKPTYVIITRNESASLRSDSMSCFIVLVMISVLFL